MNPSPVSEGKKKKVSFSRKQNIALTHIQILVTAWLHLIKLVIGIIAYECVDMQTSGINWSLKIDFMLC